jgi:hypothetical protein
MLSLLPLSDQYAAATTDAQRAVFLAAMETLGSLGVATNRTIGFFFIAIASLIISLVMLRSRIFNKATAYVGILAGILTFADDVSTIIIPSAPAILMPINLLLWVIWWISVSRGLFKFSQNTSEAQD